MTAPRVHERGLARAAFVLSLFALLSLEAKADGPPVYKDAERVGAGFASSQDTVRPRPERLRPGRLVTGGSGYVGSSWGLGKPSFSGIGTRPDDGFAGD